MSDLLQALVRDTLICLKDPLFPKQTLFATAQECSLFQRNPVQKQPVAIAPPPPKPPIQPYVKVPPSAPKEDLLLPWEVPQPAAPTLKKTAESDLKKAPLLPREISPPAAPAPKKAAESDSSDQIRKTLQMIAPGIRLTEEVPDDGEAKKIAGAYRDTIPDTEVVLLACLQDVDTLEFLKTLSKAVDQHLGKAKILSAEKIEQENRWDLFLQKNTFKLIIASEGMQQLPWLMQFYRSLPGTHPFLDKTPLLPLSSSVLYKSIEHKALLWKTLCQMLRK
jgi:hypothetical protein